MFYNTREKTKPEFLQASNGVAVVQHDAREVFGVDGEQAGVDVEPVLARRWLNGFVRKLQVPDIALLSADAVHVFYGDELSCGATLPLIGNAETPGFVSVAPGYGRYEMSINAYGLPNEDLDDFERVRIDVVSRFQTPAGGWFDRDLCVNTQILRPSPIYATTLYIEAQDGIDILDRALLVHATIMDMVRKRYRLQYFTRLSLAATFGPERTFIDDSMSRNVMEEIDALFLDFRRELTDITVEPYAWHTDDTSRMFCEDGSCTRHEDDDTDWFSRR